MAETLTLQQKMAVENRGGRLLVSAAAGSGKTKVLVDRLLSYLTDPDNSANIDDFLMITYTKAAASELRGKIAKKLNEQVALCPDSQHLQRQLQRLYMAKISTVHSFCGDVLREYAYQLDIPGDFRVADETECEEIRLRTVEKFLDEAYQKRMEDAAFRALVDTQGLGRDDRQLPQIVLKVYDSARCHLEPEKWLHHCVELVSAENVTDVGQTEYGAFLMQRLFDWLDLEIGMMQHCVELADATGELPKPTALFADTVHQMRHLREAENWEQVRQRMKIDFGRLTFPKSFADEELALHLKTIRDSAKKELEKRIKPFHDSTQQLLRDLQASALAVQGLVEMVKDFSSAYDGAKRSRRIMDFGDLEHKTLDLLLGKRRSGQTQAAIEIGSRFREVMVDEYQDSNAVQDAIYGALTDRNRNLFLVGDVKQSIYQFRLADPGIFLDKYNCFKPAAEASGDEDRKVVLSQNFRSSAGVLEGCNDVFRKCMCPEVGGMYYGEDEALHEGVPHVPMTAAETELCCVDVREETYPEEAAFVAQHIQNLLKCCTVRQGDQLRPVRPEDIVILLRSPGSSGVYYQRALESLGIGYATGGGVDLLQTEEIGTLRAILQVIHNPRLDIPLVAALTSPAFGFTADDLAQLRGKDKKCCVYDSLQRDDGEKSIAFLQTLRQLRNAVRRYSLTTLLEQVLIATSLEDVYGAMEDGKIRLANLQSFFQVAAAYEAGGNRDLGRFLEHLEMMEENGLVTPGEQTVAGSVTIMSIHKSKGLEFPVVYLCGMGRSFNMESQRANVLCHKSMGIGLSAVNGENRLRYPTIAKRAIAAKIGMESVSEELRVLYVAMTRAKDRLIMTYASDSLEGDLTKLVQQLAAGGEKMLIRQATCPGQWVLLTALGMTEAGALFALGGKPEETAVNPHPWNIRVVSAPVLNSTEQEQETQQAVSPAVLEKLKAGLEFSYGHEAATHTPSKRTATGSKGRIKDEEAAENTPKKIRRQWRKPSFQKTVDGRAYGNALHGIMQHIDYGACVSVDGVKKEILRLTQQKFISAEQAEMVDAAVIYRFFGSEMGQRIRQGTVVREFKFSIWEDAGAYDETLAGEKVLLQGVVDCALLEPDGITIIDYKSDFVTEDTLYQKVEQYEPQVQAYAEAMARIYQQPVKQRLLYFFHLNRFISI